MVGLDVSFFRGLDIVQCLGGLLVVVERREEPRFHAHVKVLHLRCVHPEILPAEGANTHELHLSLQEIDEHGQFIQPTLAELVPPIIDPVIVRELPAFLKAFVFQDVGLQILRIGVHRAKFVHTNHVSFVSHAVKFDKGAVCGIVVPDRGTELLSQNEILALMETLIHDFESGPIHPPQQFHTAVSTVFPIRHPHIEPSRPPHASAYPMPKIVHRIDRLPHQTGMRPENDLLLQSRSSGMAPHKSAIHQVFVRLVQKSIEVTDPGKSHLVDNEARMMPTQDIQRLSVIRVDDICTAVKLLLVRIQPVHELGQSEGFRRAIDPLQVHISDQLLLQLRPGLHTPFGVVLWNELFLMLEIDPGSLSLEKTHRSSSIMVEHTVSICSSVRYGCMGKERTRSQRLVATGQRDSSLRSE